MEARESMCEQTAAKGVSPILLQTRLESAGCKNAFIVRSAMKQHECALVLHGNTTKRCLF